METQYQLSDYVKSNELRQFVNAIPTIAFIKTLELAHSNNVPPQMFSIIAHTDLQNHTTTCIGATAHEILVTGGFTKNLSNKEDIEVIEHPQKWLIVYYEQTTSGDCVNYSSYVHEGNLSHYLRNKSEHITRLAK